MKQMEVPSDKRIDIDYDRPGVPHAAQVLQPVVFQSGSGFTCVFGENQTSGITGRGDTPEQALQQWGEALHAKCKTDANSELVQYINKALNEATPTSTEIIDETSDNDARIDASVMESEPIQSEFGPHNNMKKEPRKNSTDQANVNGSE